MNELLKTRLENAYALTSELVEHLDEDSLGFALQGLPSNKIFQQIWCVVGARESYLKAIVAGAWQGFSCSLTEPQVKQQLLDSLAATQLSLASTNFDGLTDEQLGFAFELLEHEVQHHGQLIRFVYANKLTFPKSWNTRYTV